MKHLKTKLFAALGMLLVAAIMMTSATYAWFTISANPEISDISANVIANGNLEIALDNGEWKEPGVPAVGDAGKNETWGNLVDLKGFFQTSTGSSGITLQPVGIVSSAIIAATSSANLDAFTYPKYGYDGRVISLETLNRKQADDGSKMNFKDFGGVWVYTTSSATAWDAGVEDEKHEVYAIEIDYWLKTNAENSTVALTSSGVSRSEDAADVYTGEMGLGSYITDNDVTILIVDTDTQTVYEATHSSAVTVGTGKYALVLKEAEWDEDKQSYVAGADEAVIDMTQNTAKLLKMYIFLNGAVIDNSAAKLELSEFTMNIQFTSSEELNAMDLPMENYVRSSANTINP